MKKTLLTAFVICASVCTAFAQEKAATTATPAVAKETTKTPEAKAAQEWQNTLVTELKLTDEQQKKIADMNKAFGERAQSIENNTELTAEEKTERKAKLKKAQDNQFLQLLTAEQQAKYKELLAKKEN